MRILKKEYRILELKFPYKWKQMSGIWNAHAYSAKKNWKIINIFAVFHALSSFLSP